MRELEFRTNFILGTISGFLWAATTFAFIGITFTNSGEIAGWNTEKAILLTLSYYVANSFYQAVFHINLSELGTDIKDGSLDNYFLKPVNSVFAVLLGKIHISQVIRTLVFVVGLTIYSFKLNPNLQLSNYLISLILIIVGSISFTLVVFVINCYSFWKPRIWNLMFLSDRIRSFSQLPSDIYKGFFKTLVFVLPVAAYATIPTKFLLGEGNLVMIIYSFVQLLIFAFIAKIVWKAGVLKYEGASS